MIVRPRTSTTSASAGQVAASRGPAAVMRSPSITTAASTNGAAPVPSIRVAPVNTRIIAQSFLVDFVARRSNQSRIGTWDRSVEGETPQSTMKSFAPTAVEERWDSMSSAT